MRIELIIPGNPQMTHLVGTSKPRFQIVECGMDIGLQRKQMSKIMDTVCCEESVGETFKSEACENDHTTGSTRLDDMGDGG